MWSLLLLPHYTSHIHSNLIPLFFPHIMTTSDRNIMDGEYFSDGTSNVWSVPLFPSFPRLFWLFDGLQKLHIFLFECFCSVVYFSLCAPLCMLRFRITDPHYSGYLVNAFVSFRQFPFPLVSQWSVWHKPQTGLSDTVCSRHFNCRCCYLKGWMSKLDEHGKVNA